MTGRIKIFMVLLLLLVFHLDSPVGAVALEMAEDTRIPIVPYPQEVSMGNDHFDPPGSGITLRLSGLEGRSADIIPARTIPIKHDRARSPTRSVQA